jgi:hypothetical protein
MRRIRSAACLAPAVAALAAASAFAQVFDRPPPPPPVPNAGGVNEQNDVQICGNSTGATRTRPACDLEEIETVVIEQELRLSIDLAPLPQVAECEAVATTEYRQQNTIARVASTIELRDCSVAASGEFTFFVSVRDDSGEIKPLEFKETWQRGDDRDVEFAADYAIGEDVELVSVRMRGLTCTCADAPSTAPPRASAVP